MSTTVAPACSGVPVAVPPIRLECHCNPFPCLLAMQARDGQITVKLRDRFLWITGTVTMACPRCGACHTFTSHPMHEETLR